MKLKDRVQARMRDMLTKDKLGYADGFMTAFKGDLRHLVGDYFDIDGDLNINIEQREDGKYVLSVVAVASKLKLFDTTIEKTVIKG